MNLRTLLLVCSIGMEAPGVYSENEETLTSFQDHYSGPIEDSGPKKEVPETKDKFAELLARMEELEAREKSREKTYKMEIQKLHRQLSAQSRRTATLERMVKSFSERLSVPVKEKGNRLGKTFVENETPAKSLRLRSRSEKTPERIRRAENEHPVAFFAKLTHHMTHVGAHQPIVFDHVETNIGNAYNNHVGSFIAPVPGTYVFSTTLFTLHQTSYHAQFVKNGQPVTLMYLSGSEAGYDTASQTIVLQLQNGDDISVQNYNADKPIHGYNYTTFAGFLLQEDVSVQSIVG